jgi:hypothetical protein
MSNSSEKIVLPRPTPEIVEDVFGKKADADGEDAFDDLIIEIDEDEVEAEESAPSRRKV